MTNVFLFAGKHRPDRIPAHKTTYPRRQSNHFTALTRRVSKSIEPSQAMAWCAEHTVSETVVQFQRYKQGIVCDQYGTGLATQSISDPLAATIC